ncbi:MAG: HugZ family protein [Rhodospirillales bacterium]|tara:strand:+ start:540 stop:1289 length:750 start_codon:yes stop_codon:yes gene_type:complete
MAFKKDIRTYSDDILSRFLIRTSRKAFLSTLTKSKGQKDADWPSISLVTTVAAWDSSPVMLLSDISNHTQNIHGNPRCALMFDGTAGYSNPQEGPRISVVGRIKKTTDQRLHKRYLKYNWSAARYSSFGDFNFYKMEIDRIHLVGGFARSVWLPKDKIILKKQDWMDIAEAERDILAHMNDDHKETLKLYGNKLLGKNGLNWFLVGIDPEGLDLRCGSGIHRVNFDEINDTVKMYKNTLVALSKLVRKY